MSREPNDTCASKHRREAPHPPRLVWLIFINARLLNTVARHGLDFDNPSQTRCLRYRADQGWSQPAHSGARLEFRLGIGERRPRLVTPPIAPSSPRLWTQFYIVRNRLLSVTRTIVSVRSSSPVYSIALYWAMHDALWRR